jgi:lipopolysaccharide export LptBFGC system permease protein LptF
VDRWVANTDYQIGNTVEYANGFYVAKQNHNSGVKFDFEKWTKKKSKPSAQLIPNFDYKIAQFNDFYNLETNNFDETQQKLAQHLTGYQSRPYLENLFLNDVSQYKFYQGFIREKGTQNAIDRLVKAKFYGENINLKVYPEWMIKVGEFGNLDGSKSIQLILSDNNFTSNININELKNVYKNTETTSLLDINKEMLILEDKGYSTVDLRIRYQKLISFPIYLLAMSILSGLMIINLGKTSNYLKYGIYGVIISIIIYFLNDLSITVAKSGIISVDFSVWIPIFLIILINLIGITQVNAK